nr:hypothetical protein [Candidatus Baldrarchaeota archaeon]
MPRKKKSGLKILAEILALIGATILIVYGAMYIVGISLTVFSMFHMKTVIFSLGRIINGIILILIGLIVFASYDVIKISLKTEMTWTTLLVLGIASLIFGGGLGSLLILLAAIIDLVATV